MRNKNPRPDRNRKHKPYGFHSSKYDYKDFKRNGWSPDCEEMRAMGEVSSKAKGRRSGKLEIDKQLDEYYSNK